MTVKSVKPKRATKKKATRPPTERPANNSRIPDDVRAFIIMSYARFCKTNEIHKALIAEFDLDLDQRSIANHQLDRESRANCLGPRWRALFDETRAEFLNAIDRIPIAHPAYRLAKLQRYFDLLDAKDAIGPATAVLEQAAKESGGAFTNKREMQAKVKVDDETPRDTTEMRAVLVAAIEDALQDLGKGQQPTTH